LNILDSLNDMNHYLYPSIFSIIHKSLYGCGIVKFLLLITLFISTLLSSEKLEKVSLQFQWLLV